MSERKRTHSKANSATPQQSHSSVTPLTNPPSSSSYPQDPLLPTGGSSLEPQDDVVPILPEGRRFGVRKWNAVAQWSWDIEVENCAICHNHLMDPCIHCQACQPSISTEDCTVAWGACNHAFHQHCIARWVTTRQVCPLDNRDWVPNRYGR